MKKRIRLGFAFLVVVFLIAFIKVVELSNYAAIAETSFPYVHLLWEAEPLGIVSYILLGLWIISLIGFIVSVFFNDIIKEVED